MQCADCRYFEADPSIAQGTCRRYAPRARIIARDEFVPGECGAWTEPLEGLAYFPIVSSDNWCGEFVYREKHKT